MGVLDQLTTTRTKRNDASGYGPALALGYPERGRGWARPWGRIETATVSTRKSRRTLSVTTSERHIATLTTGGLTPEQLSSRTWRRARNFRRGHFLDAFVYPFLAVLVIGALLLGTLLYPLASILAVALLIVLAIAVGIVGLLRYRTLAEQAHAGLTSAGYDWREIELGDDDALARLIHSLDALAYSREQGKVAEDVWTTASNLTFAVTEEARRGALIDDDNHELRTARDYIAAAREHLATTGSVDRLDLPDTNNA